MPAGVARHAPRLLCLGDVPSRGTAGAGSTRSGAEGGRAMAVSATTTVAVSATVAVTTVVVSTMSITVRN